MAENKKVVIDGEVKDYESEEKRFSELPEEIRCDFCDCFEEYVLKNEGIIFERVFTPSEYGEVILGENFADDISIAEFDKEGDKYNIWNYPLSEADYVMGNNINVVLVKFHEGYRLVEAD